MVFSMRRVATHLKIFIIHQGKETACNLFKKSLCSLYHHSGLHLLSPDNRLLYIPLADFDNVEPCDGERDGGQEDGKEHAFLSQTSSYPLQHQLTSPLKNRCNSDWRILHPFPALIALILPRRIYFKKVGLEIFRYSIASSVVKTGSFSIIDIELPPFVFILVYLKQDICRKVLDSITP